MKRNRKQIYELTLADLRKRPVWEFALDEEGEEDQDEATVRPWNAEVTADDAGLIVRATFTLADGTSHSGFVTLPTAGDDGAAAVQPVLVTDAGQVMFWHGVLTPKPEWIADAYRKLGGSAKSVFPVHYASDVPGGAALVKGVIEGFLSYRSFKDQRVVETR